MKTIDEYIAASSDRARPILKKIRAIVRKAAPEATETISYGIPTFKLNGTLVHFAAFKNHIGFYPPVKGDAGIEKALKPYAGEKGNLKFPLDEPIPYTLIERIVRLRVKQQKSRGVKAAASSLDR
jgi:uncharacterized protein YdhG (YjbR/CyaY superfamily)